MKKKKEEECGSDSDTVPSGPVSFRREVRGGNSRNQALSRQAALASRRKKAKPGGIHQRANKRTNW